MLSAIGVTPRWAKPAGNTERLLLKVRFLIRQINFTILTNAFYNLEEYRKPAHSQRKACFLLWDWEIGELNQCECQLTSHECLTNDITEHSASLSLG